MSFIYSYNIQLFIYILPFSRIILNHIYKPHSCYRYMIFSQKTKELANLLSLPALTGHISIFATTGFLILKNSPLLGLLFIAGPASLILAATLGGTARDNLITIVTACIIALFALSIAALVGVTILQHFNIRILQITSGIILIFIALSLFGANIPSFANMTVLGIGVVASIFVKVIV